MAEQELLCVICRQPIDDEWSRTGKEYCFSCNQEKVRPKQKVREQRQFNARDRISEVYAEMRAAIADRDRYRREADTIMSHIESSVEAGIVAKIKTLPFWTRIKLVFSPFHVHL